MKINGNHLLQPHNVSWISTASLRKSTKALSKLVTKFENKWRTLLSDPLIHVSDSCTVRLNLSIGVHYNSAKELAALKEMEDGTLSNQKYLFDWNISFTFLSITLLKPIMLNTRLWSESVWRTEANETYSAQLKIQVMGSTQHSSKTESGLYFNITVMFRIRNRLYSFFAWHVVKILKSDCFLKVLLFFYWTLMFIVIIAFTFYYYL